MCVDGQAGGAGGVSHRACRAGSRGSSPREAAVRASTTTTDPRHTWRSTLSTAAGTTGALNVKTSTKMACLFQCGRALTRKAYPPRTMSVYYLHIMTILLQFLLTFAQGQGSGGGREAALPPVDERVSFEIYEGQPSGTEVGQIEVQPDLTYRFSEDPGVFSLNPDTGQITTARVIDRESLNEDSFNLFIQSAPSARHLVEVKITVLDINDNNPQFGQPSINVTFSETAQPGTQVILDTATDKDMGINDVLQRGGYAIISGNNEGKFRLVLLTEASKPLLYLENTVELDREEKEFYQLNISAQDGGSPPRFGYLQVNITITDFNDNPPLFDQSDYSAKINETSRAGSSVVQVRATDRDAGRNGDITYNIINDDYEQFAVEAKTGVVTTRKRLTCQERSCFVTVEAKDQGQPPLKGRAYVTVNLIDENDHDPVIIFSYSGQDQRSYATVDEGARDNTVVAVVSVTDQDQGRNGNTSVKIIRGNERGHFKLQTDIIQVSGRLDRERVGKYNLTIEARDHGQPSRSSTSHLIIVVNDINDHRPVFQEPFYVAELGELVPVGSYVSSITATDNDTGINAHITYTIVSGDDQGWFSINRDTGLVTTNTELDHERQSHIFLRILAQDGGNKPFRSYTNLTITIWDENDEIPTFPQKVYALTLREGAPANTELITATAVDRDQGRNGSILYRLDPEADRLYPGVFKLDQKTGRITTLVELDREQYDHFNLKLIAQDGGVHPLSSTATITVNVSDVNDNTPVFYPVKYYASVLENQPAHTQVVQVHATDSDQGNNALIHYNIVKPNRDAEKFTININTGQISTIDSLDRETQAVYRLRVSAYDQGQPQRTTVETAEVVVTVNDIQDTPPDFSAPQGYAFTITEDNGNSAPRLGRMVGVVKATSRDAGGSITYSIASGDQEGVFTINAQTGTISAAKAVDREVADFYRLNVIASGGAVHGETTANITVTDLNDNSPSFGRNNVQTYVVENWPVGHEVYLADAVDPDAGNNGKVTYTLATGSSPVFGINSDTGMVYLAQSLRDVTASSFKVSAVASDAGQQRLSAKLDVTIILRDVNDHTPVFDQASYEVSIMESRPVNDRFYRAVATDDDLGLNGEMTYWIKNGNIDSKFGIFPDGVLYIAETLDRETRDLYILTVAVKDMGVEPRSSQVNVSIHILDANDNRPVFSNYTYRMRIPENSARGTYVGAVTATDADVGRNAEVTYHISTKQKNFDVHPKTGVIVSLVSFDREEVKKGGHDFLSLVVIASDGGANRMEEQAVVNIEIVDTNDNAPKFSRDLYKPSLFENAELNTQVVRVSATDADSGINSKIMFSITEGNEDGAFAIDGVSGQVSLVGALDRETTPEYMLTILAMDGGEPTLNATAFVKVTILDNNDNAPVFAQSATSFDVVETTQVGTYITQVTAKDPDFGSNAQITYQIQAGNKGTKFHIDGNTGKLYLAAAVDYEEQQQYNLKIAATDYGNPRLSSVMVLIVNILDFNDNGPAFSSAPLVRQIEERVQVGTSITVMRASDPDSGVNGDLRYSISKQHPAGDHFIIDPVTGLVSTSKEIDREAAASYKLTVVATDQAQPSSMRKTAEKLVTVLVKDLNDNAPQFVSMNAIAVDLGTQVDTRIATVLALDEDEGRNGEVQYSLLAGDVNYFHIDEDNGNLYVKQNLGNQAQKFTLTVQARDKGSADILGAKSSSFPLTIFTKSRVENGPEFSEASYSGQLYENEAKEATILTVKASYSANPSASIEYYITRITSVGIEQHRFFQIDRTSGVITTTQSLDRERGYEEFDITVYAVERNAAQPQSRTTQVHVTLLDRNDSPPQFSPAQLELTVSEDATPGYSVASVVATDADTDGTLIYSVRSGDRANTFSVDPALGVLTLIRPLDRETVPEYNLEIEASDGVQSSAAHVRITVTDVNDQRPSFDKNFYSFDVPEDARTGTTVGRVSALDADLGENGEVSYSMVSRWGRGKFSLQTNSGVFTLIDNLDFEQVEHFVLVVRAEDHGRPALSSTVTVVMNIRDINDNAPVFDPGSYSDEVSENATVGTSVLTVTSTDIDTGVNGRAVYTLTGGDPRGQFAVESDTGIVRTAKPLDREGQAYYQLAVTATDQAVHPDNRLSSTAMISIILKDANDNAPEFVSPNHITVMENTPAGTSVAKLSTTDKDEGRNGYVEYSLTGGSRSLFTIGSVDGVLKVKQSLDRETTDQYTIVVTATDKGIPPQKTSTTFLVNVGDDNDNSPVFSPRGYQKVVAEDIKVGTSLLALTATDRDIGVNSDIRYIIVEGDNNEDFRLDSHTGELYVRKRLDYERVKEYVLRVTAEDQGEEMRSDFASVTIRLTDINDNSPTFVNLPYLAYVQENLDTAPVHVIGVTARDPDTSWSGHVRYSLMDGDRSLFRINSTSGEIEALRSFDREDKSSYELLVRAVDSGSPRLSSTCWVTVLVQDVNDHSPAFPHSHYTARVGENEAPPTGVMKVLATDADTGTNAQISYSLVEDGNGQFGVRRATGQIFTTQLLNREQQDTYNLVVMATDGGMIARSSSASVKVTVEDKNDNNPHFTQRLYKTLIRDPTNPGMFVMGVTAVDPDSGANGQIVYSISNMRDSSSFNIDSETGIITAARRLVGRQRPSRTYNLLVRATDKGQNPLHDEVNVEVQLLSDSLTNFPTLTAPQTTFTLPETVSVGHHVTSVTGTSPKAGTTLAYRIAGGNVDQSFNIDAQGHLKVAKALDYERTSSSFGLWLEVYDDSETSLSSYMEVKVNLQDYNDNPPVFDKTFYEVTIKEEEYPPISVLRVTASDADSGDNGRVTYRVVSGNVGGAFLIDSSQGQIRTEVKLDREVRAKYSLEIEAADHGQPAWSATTIVDIEVADVNDKPPVFTQHFQDTQIPENIPVGTSILKITASDGDQGINALHSYAFIPSHTPNKFAIDRMTGVVTIASPLDYEEKNNYILKVSTNDGAHNAETPVTIGVTDVNDNPPRFTQSQYRFDLVERQAAKTLIGTVVASDRDSKGPNSEVYYIFKKPTKDFSLDVSSGKIYSRRELVYKTSGNRASPENLHKLRVLAMDRGEPPLSSETVITVEIKPANKYAPVLEKTTYRGAAPENAPVGYSILKLEATDEQVDGTQGVVEFVVSGGNGTGRFNLNQKTGELKVSSSMAGLQGQMFLLRVNAADKGVPPRATPVDVIIQVATINRNAPRFQGSTASFQATVQEDKELQSVLPRVTATDPDSGPNGMVSYFLTGGDPAGQFSIDESQGYIRIMKRLDYETRSVYHLNITARDRGLIPRQTTRVFTLYVTDVNDNAPEFPAGDIKAYVKENSPSGTVVYTATTTDADTGENAEVEYHIVGNGEAMDTFSVDPKSGVIRSQGAIDYEMLSEYELVLKALNPGTSLSSTATVHVHVTGVNEYLPQFTQQEYQFVISESAARGDVVGRVQAQDQDGSDDGVVLYYLVGDSNIKGFSLNPNTGAVSIASSIDRESTSEIILDILAKNRGPIRGNNTSTCKVRVMVRDANDPPLFSRSLYDAAVREDAVTGTSVLQVKAADNDLQSNFRRFTYQIKPSRWPVAFQIDPTTGQITTRGKLDRETQPLHNFTIIAVDSGVPPMTGSASVRVTVLDVNDNGPHFEPAVPEGDVTENKGPFTEVILDLARFTSDLDSRPNQGPYKYRLLDHTMEFDVGLTSGLISAKVKLDRERISEYLLPLEVADSGNPVMSSTLTARVIVKDENDNPSAPRTLEVVVQAYNGTFSGGVVADVRPLDADTVGDWQCRITQGDLSVLSIRQACRLEARRVRSGRQFNLNVSGSDGVHQAVQYSMRVEFHKFDHLAAQHSIIVRVDVPHIKYFLNMYFKKFLNAVNGVLEGGTTAELFGMTETGSFTNLYMAGRQTNGGYVSRAAFSQMIRTQKAEIEKQTGLMVDDVNYNPCKDSPCLNGAECRADLTISGYTVHDSPSLVFTAPTVNHSIQCRCLSGFTGNHCEKSLTSCTLDPCNNGGTCLPTNAGTRCVCPPGWQGDVCDKDVNECRSNPCRHGGTCSNLLGSYKCDCVARYTGKSCELRNDHCASSPCQNGGTCVSHSSGFRCDCGFSARGTRCEVRSRGFLPQSYIEHNNVWDPQHNNIIMEFATTAPNALLLYGAGEPTRADVAEFVAVEIVSGLVRFSFGLGEDSITRMTVPKIVSDGRWYRVEVDRNQKVATLKVSECPEGDVQCNVCTEDDQTCFRRGEYQGVFTELQLKDDILSIGGVRNLDLILANPGQVQNHDFVGCMRALLIDDVDLLTFKTRPYAQALVTDSCPRVRATMCTPDSCANDGICVDEWSDQRCVCPVGYAQPDCRKESAPFSFGADSMVMYSQKESYKRDRLLAAQGGARSRRRRDVISGQSGVSLTFQTSQEDGLLFHAATGADSTALRTVKGKLEYWSVVRGQTYSLTPHTEVDVTDSKWHNVTVLISGLVVSLQVDSSSTEKSFVSPVHDPLGFDVTYMSVGGSTVPVLTPDGVKAKGFEGCMKEVRLDGKVLPFDGSTDRFVAEPVGSGAKNITCPGALTAATTAGKPLHVAVIVVIVFFAILIAVILVTFFVIRYRRRRRGQSAGQAPKLNGDIGGVKSNVGPMLDKTSNDSRSHQDSGFTENGGDLSEEAIIQQHVARELATQMYNEREVREQFGQSRPDLVAPEMGGTVHLPAGEGGVPLENGVDNTGYSEEPPEHYDIDNASSIAPSDLVDVVGHYKRYRQLSNGGNNKHQYNTPGGGQQRHPHSRHTPSPAAMLGGKPYTIRESPLTVANRGPSPAAGMLNGPHRDSPNIHAMASTPLGRGVSPLPHMNGNLPPRQQVANLTGPSPPGVSPVIMNNLSRQSPITALGDRATSPLSHNQLTRGQSPAVHQMRDKRMSPLPHTTTNPSLRSTPVNGLYQSNASNSSASYSDRNPALPNGHPGGHQPARPNSRLRQPLNQLRGTPTRGLTVEDVERLNARTKPSPVSTLDVGSSSGDEVPDKKLPPQYRGPISPFGPPTFPVAPAPDSSSDDGSSDSFTCSEFEYDNDKVRNTDLNTHRLTFPKLTEVSENDDTDVSRTFTPNGSDSNREGSLSTFFSDEDMPKSGSKLLNGGLNWDYLLNWGPNFEKLVGVFKDIAELPDGNKKPVVETGRNDTEPEETGVNVDFVSSEPTNSQVREEYV